jgi:hypothetical protein
MITYPNFTPPPRNPANSCALVFRRAFMAYARLHWQVTQHTRFQAQREKEIAAEVMHKAVLKECEGESPLPYPRPFWWDAERLRHFANGGQHPVPAFIATIGTRVSAFRKPLAEGQLAA